MKKEEYIAMHFLKSLGKGLLTYEPCGRSKPPDFLLASEIAVEVRRLNQNRFALGKVQGLEEAYYSLTKAMTQVFKEFDTLQPVERNWVVLEYKRPIGRLKFIKNNTRQAINMYLENRKPIPTDFRVSSNVRIRIIPSLHMSTKRFRIGVDSDEDAGGWVIPMYIENINHCIREKDEKVLPCYKNYDHWWLILVDTILCIGPEEYQKVINQMFKSELFDKVIVIGYESKTKLFEF